MQKNSRYSLPLEPEPKSAHTVQLHLKELQQAPRKHKSLKCIPMSIGFCLIRLVWLALDSSRCSGALGVAGGPLVRNCLGEPLRAPGDRRPFLYGIGGQVDSGLRAGVPLEAPVRELLYQRTAATRIPCQTSSCQCETAL
jgi:hypothetical protein